VLGTFDPRPATPGLDRLRRTSTGYAGPGRRGEQHRLRNYCFAVVWMAGARCAIVRNGVTRCHATSADVATVTLRPRPHSASEVKRPRRRRRDVGRAERASGPQRRGEMFARPPQSTMGSQHTSALSKSRFPQLPSDMWGIISAGWPARHMMTPSFARSARLGDVPTRRKPFDGWFALGGRARSCLLAWPQLWTVMPYQV
jgi:hypothetical protein